MAARAGPTPPSRRVAEAKGTSRPARARAAAWEGEMAYKDMLVYLDPTVEAVERIRFAVSLAKTHGARLIGVDVSAPPAGQEAETEAAVSRTFSDTTRDSGLTTIFAPPQKPGEL